MMRPRRRVRDALAAAALAALAGHGPALAQPVPPVATPSPASAAVRGASERASWLAMFARAYYPGRSGQVMVVPREGDILTLKRDDVPFMHGSPWGYDARIPLIFWGPRHVRAGRRTDTASQQDIAPTLGHALGLPMPGVTGKVLSGALRPGASPPKLVVLVVLDGFRADYLDQYASLLPNLTRLRREGASFERARVSHLPTITTVGHSTIATGTDPRFHGIVANTFFDRVAGKPADPFPGFSPDNLMALALADRWSWQTDGRAVIAAQSSSPSATALAGHGACALNGRRVAYASYSWTSGRWETNAKCYRLPAHLEGVDVRTLWDGTDGQWMGHPANTPETVRRTAPFARFEGDALVSTIEKEAMGDDDVADLVLANLKVVDTVGHAYGPDSPEVRETIAEVDRQIGRVLETAVAKAGREGVLVAVTADHGMPSEPPAGRGRHYNTDMVRLVHRRLDPEAKLVIFYTSENGQIFIDESRARTLGVRLEQVRDLLQAEPYVAAAFTEDEVRRVRLP